jgi:hypothetical protein
VAKIVKWNADKLIKRVPLVLTNYGIKVTPLLQESIKAKIYPWPTVTDQGGRIVTLRNNGEEVTTPRNIVDTGTLLRSQSAPKITANSLRIIWGAPYSGEVLRGGYVVGRSNGNYIAPDRDWITPVLRTEPPLKFFAAEWRKIGGA